MRLQPIAVAATIAALAGGCTSEPSTPGENAAQETPMTSQESVHSFKARTHTDEELDFKTLAGRCLLIVNVASM